MSTSGTHNDAPPLLGTRGRRRRGDRPTPEASSGTAGRSVEQSASSIGLAATLVGPHVGDTEQCQEVLGCLCGHPLRSIKPSRDRSWDRAQDARPEHSPARTAFTVLHRTLDLAVDDEGLKGNLAKARVVKLSSAKDEKIVAWGDAVALLIVECYPPQ
jgi:hypothetical protein